MNNQEGILKDIDLKKFYTELTKDLSCKSDVAKPEQEAMWILKHCLKVEEPAVLAGDKVDIPQLQAVSCLSVVKRRLSGMPLAYAMGEVDFCDLKLNTWPPVLIPRPETEEWVESLCNSLNALKINDLKVLDLCSGSGCISLSLAKKLEGKSSVLGVDISKYALNLAKINQKKNEIENCKFTRSNLFSKIKEQFDLIVCNPPYLSEEEYKNLDPSVLNWEDSQALVGGNDGLFFYRKIISQVKPYLTKTLSEKGHSNLFFEIGHQQAESVVELLKAAEFKNIEVKKDLAGKDRVVSCQAF